MKHCLIIALLACGTWATAASETNNEAVAAAVTRLLPNLGAPTISASPLAGISEVALGTQVFYVSNDGRYVLGGPLLAADDGSNLTEPAVARARSKILQDSAAVRTYRYPANKSTAGTRQIITVITDIDCPYCRRLHSDMEAYQAAGFDVNYVMLPRAGKDSASYRKTVSAACAENPEEAITAAMAGQVTPPATCDNPIDEHMALARRLGISSTPSIVLADGRLVLGQKKPADLLKLAVAR